MQKVFETVNEQFEQCYYTFSKTEVNALINDALENNDPNDIERVVKTKIEEIINEDIDKPILSRINLKFLRPVKKNNALVVLAQYCTFPDVILLDFPRLKVANPKDLVTEITEVLIAKMMANTPNMPYNDVATITQTTLVKYKLYDQGKLFDEREEFISDGILAELTSDTYLLNTLYDIFEDVKLLQIEFVSMKNYDWKKLTDKDVSKINFLGTKTPKELFDKIYRIANYEILADKYLEIVLSYYQNEGIIKITDEVRKFFTEGFIKYDEEEYEKSVNEMEGRIIKQMIATEISRTFGFEISDPEKIGFLRDCYALRSRTSKDFDLDYFGFFDNKLCDLYIIDFCIKQGYVQFKI